MSTLAKIIYEETGLTQSGTPDEYEEVASACRRFALHCEPRQPLTDEQIARAWSIASGEHNASSSVKRRITRSIERAHGIEGEV